MELAAKDMRYPDVWGEIISLIEFREETADGRRIQTDGCRQPRRRSSRPLPRLAIPIRWIIRGGAGPKKKQKKKQKRKQKKQNKTEESNPDIPQMQSQRGQGANGFGGKGEGQGFGTSPWGETAGINAGCRATATERGRDSSKASAVGVRNGDAPLAKYWRAGEALVSIEKGVRGVATTRRVGSHRR